MIKNPEYQSHNRQCSLPAPNSPIATKERHRMIMVLFLAHCRMTFEGCLDSPLNRRQGGLHAAAEGGDTKQEYGADAEADGEFHPDVGEACAADGDIEQRREEVVGGEDFRDPLGQVGPDEEDHRREQQR